MKAIDVSTTTPTLAQVLNLASEANVILRTAEGRQFVLAEIDDFADEIDSVRRNEALMRLLDERSKEPATLSTTEARELLHNKKKRER